MSTPLPPTTLHSSPSPNSPHTTKRKKPPPISISTNPSDLNPLRLRDLLHSSNLSCHRFPALGPDGRAEPVDVNKLRTALSNSSVVVSAFCKSKFLSGDQCDGVPGFDFEQLFERAVPLPVGERQLVGFGRAVSDGGLTASIHDVVVTPSLQRMGIGRKIIQRIIRVLTSKDIYDISALCSEKERSFFKACGFGNDPLGATTMMYTWTSPTDPEGERVRFAGRMMLLVPPPLEDYISQWGIAAEGDDLLDSQTVFGSIR